MGTKFRNKPKFFSTSHEKKHPTIDQSNFLNDVDGKILEKINSLIAKKKFDNALEIIAERLNTFPSSTKLLQLRGVILSQQDNQQEALAVFKKILDLAPTSSSSFSNYGLALEKNGLVETAIQVYGEGLEIDPESAYLNHNLAVALAGIGKVEEALKSGKIAARNLNNKQRCVFLDRDGVINIDTDLIDRPEDLELYPYAASSIRRLNKMGFLVVVVTNQSVIARGLCTIATLDEIHKKMETELGQEGAFVEAIYFCPHHPHSGYDGEVKEYKVECSCRKPKPGMLQEAANRFNIDLTKSYLVGDSPRDIEAGARAGVETIRVKTGHGLKPHTEIPMHYVADLAAAVDLIERQS